LSEDLLDVILFEIWEISLYKKLVIGLVFVLIVVGLSGCVQEDVEKYEDFDNRVIREESIGGISNATIIYEQIYYDGIWGNGTRLKYTKDGRDYYGAYMPFVLDALNWVKMNTSKNTTILCWWDYGHMIEGIAERNAIATYVSEELIHTAASLKEMSKENRQTEVERGGGWSSNDVLIDIALVLSNTDILNPEIQNILNRYNVSYILTVNNDKYFTEIFFETAGLNVEEYIKDGIPTEKGNNTLIYKMREYPPDIYGLSLVYNDYYCKIFELV
jgi:asparagine N-glycosylation enzyme membrane subunit Stt3